MEELDYTIFIPEHVSVEGIPLVAQKLLGFLYFRLWNTKAKETGIIYVTRDTIIKELSIGVSTFIYARSILIAKGLLVFNQGSKRVASKNGISSSYRIPTEDRDIDKTGTTKNDSSDMPF